MKRIFTLFFLGLLALPALAQNLVPNPSFETIGTPPCSWLTAPSQLPPISPPWTMPSNGSTDIFSNYVATSCYAHNFSVHASTPGQQAPRTGNVQSALVTYGTGCGTNYREYLQVQLTSPMVVGQLYDFEFWLSFADYSYLATNNFGIRFNTATTFVSTCDNVPQIPQFNSTTVITDKVGWTRVSGSITATAAWSYIIIGNFYLNSATTTTNVGSGVQLNARYYIDDIMVRLAILDVDAALDLRAERNADGGVDLDWSGLSDLPAEGYELQRSVDGSVWEAISEPEAQALHYTDRFAPNTALTYRLRYRDAVGNLHTSPDAVVAHRDGLPYRLILSSNPARPGSHSTLIVANADDAVGAVTITDMSGRKVWEAEPATLIELGGLALPTETLRPGMYIISLQVDGETLHTRWVIGN